MSAHAYQYNSANQRTNATLADGSVWRYAYDKLGQVTSGRKYWADGTPVAGQQFDYSFDDIGNRKSAGKGGDHWGANLRYENYTANNLNQYLSRSVPGGVDILGAANSNATVTILTGSNGVAAPLPGAVPGVYATSRKGEYFRGEAWVNNSTGAVWLTLTNSAVLQTATNDLFTNFTGNVLVSKTPEVFAYDADGNLTNDARWSYIWDAQNRLVRMVSRTDTPTNVWQALNFAYDWQDRRISKVISNWNGTAWTKTTDVRFVYDGWNLLAILNPQSSILQSFLWGLDLSGSLQGAGGVGGLLEVTIHSGPNTGAYVSTYDGNGNVMALVSAANGTVSAQYEYGAFAESIRGTGPLLKENPFRFSTKFRDDETELIYYGYRYVANGRWLSRDPLVETGGRNLYSFLANEALSDSDYLGWGVNDPPPTIPGAVKPCKPCCCCADDLSIMNIIRMGPRGVVIPGGKWIPAAYGHSFDVVAKMSFIRTAFGGLAGGCAMRWVETANMVTTGLEGYMRPNVPLDIFSTPVSTQQRDDWWKQTANPPCPGSLTATINDTPSIQAGYNGPQRVLSIVITLESTAYCPCASRSKSVTFNQVLTFKNGTADWSNSSP